MKVMSWEILKMAICRLDFILLMQTHPKLALHKLKPILLEWKELIVVKSTVNEVHIRYSLGRVFFITRDCLACDEVVKFKFYKETWTMGNHFVKLDRGALFSIFKFLPVKDLSNCRFVCKQFKNAAYTDSLWEKFALSKFQSSRFAISERRLKNCCWMHLYDLCNLSWHGSKGFRQNVGRYFLDFHTGGDLGDFPGITEIVINPPESKSYYLKIGARKKFFQNPRLIARTKKCASDNLGNVECYAIIDENEELWFASRIGPLHLFLKNCWNLTKLK